MTNDELLLHAADQLIANLSADQGAAIDQAFAVLKQIHSLAIAGYLPPQPAPLSADERAETRRVLKPFAEIGTRYLTDEMAKRTTHPSRILDHERPTVGECRLAAYLYQRLGEAGEPDTVAGSAALIRKLAERAGMTPSEFAKAFDALTPEQCRAAMKRGDA